MKSETYSLKILERLFSKSFKRQSLILYFQFAHAQSVYFFLLILYSFLGKKLAYGKGLSGKDRLTLASIDDIPNFFGTAIRKNNGNPQNMVKEIWAILDHYSSRVDQPKHNNCPKGQSSWYLYQRDILTGQRTYKPAKWPLTKVIVDVLHPLFIWITNEGFLDRYSKFVRVVQFTNLDPPKE